MKERVDKTKNKTKVISAVLNNPLATEREIAKKTKLGNGTVHNHLKDIEQNGAKSKVIDEILERDTRITTLGQEIMIERMTKNPDKISNKDIISATDSAVKRQAIFKNIHNPESKENGPITIIFG